MNISRSKLTRTERVHESHQPWDESVTSPLEDVKEGSKERGTQDKCHSPSLQEVNNKETWRRLVESMFFFEDKGAVNRQRKGRNGRYEVEYENKGN